MYVANYNIKIKNRVQWRITSKNLVRKLEAKFGESKSTLDHFNTTLQTTNFRKLAYSRADRKSICSLIFAFFLNLFGLFLVLAKLTGRQ